MEYRIEHDSMGEVQVPADRYWGAQTQRSFQNFPIGTEKIPMEVIRAFAILKKAAAIANNRLGKLDDKRLALISQACGESRMRKLMIPQQPDRPDIDDLIFGDERETRSDK